MRLWIPIVLAVAACSGPSAIEPSPTSPGRVTVDPTRPTTTVGTGAVLPDGFELVQARVTEPDGTVCELCVWLADDGDRRARGLMFVTDLGPADGMAFRYPRPRTGNFWMKDTILDLSIAFFDASGAYLDAFDMAPCETDPCPRYRTAPDFQIAVETHQGDLPALGMILGSTFELLDLACDDT